MSYFKANYPNQTRSKNLYLDILAEVKKTTFHKCDNLIQSSSPNHSVTNSNCLNYTKPPNLHQIIQYKTVTLEKRNAYEKQMYSTLLKVLI